MKSFIQHKLSILFYGVDNSNIVNSYDYIINNIFANFKCIECDYLMSGEEELSDKIYDVFIYHCADPNRHMHFGFAPTYEQTKNAVLKFKPKIIIQLSDEYYAEHNEVHNLLSGLCNLFLREHRHQSHLHTYSKNIINIPLGYCNGFLNQKQDKLKSPKERKYTWSWVGFLKTDRSNMISNFWNMWKNLVITNAYIPTNEIYEIYSESIFVPCGRGNISLDCYRLYETLIAGAIPVVVGPLDEIEINFNFFGEKPPWIYAESWEDAVSKCQEIQFDYDTLEKIQNENLIWWNNTMSKMHFSIDEALNEDRLEFTNVLLEQLKNKENNLESPKQVVWYNQKQNKIQR